MQGPVHFDENGIRNVAELRVLQYRKAYVNGTPIDDTTDLNNATLELVEVAYVTRNESNLEFLDDNHSIWPSEGHACTMKYNSNSNRLLYYS